MLIAVFRLFNIPNHNNFSAINRSIINISNHKGAKYYDPLLKGVSFAVRFMVLFSIKIAANFDVTTKMEGAN